MEGPLIRHRYFGPDCGEQAGTYEGPAPVAGSSLAQSGIAVAAPYDHAEE